MMKKIIYTCLMVFTISHSVYGNNEKPKTDTIILNLEKGIELIFPLYDITNINEYENINQLLDSILINVGKITDMIKEEKLPYVINLSGNQKDKIISVVTEKEVRKNIVITSEGEAIELPQKNALHFTDGEKEIKIRFVNIEDLIALNTVGIDEKIKYVQKKNEEEGGFNRHSRSMKYDFLNKKSEAENTHVNYQKNYDMLQLSFSTGANLIRDKFVPDLGFKVGFIFNKKGVFKNDFNLQANILYFSDRDEDGDFNTDINTLLSLGYRYNLSYDKDKSNWVGFDVGYVINPKGDYFKENTFMVGANWEITNHRIFNISASPRLYFTDNFKEMIPTIRIGFGF